MRSMSVLKYTLSFVLVLNLASGGVGVRSQEAMSCTDAMRFADKVIQYTKGEQTHPDWDDPSEALGAPDFGIGESFGIVHLGLKGSLTLALVNNTIVDGPGNDLMLWGDRSNDELVIFEVSENGEDYVSFDLVDENGELDLADLGDDNPGVVRFVRISDEGSREQVAQNIDTPGAEIDAIEALNCEGVDLPDSDGDGVPDEDDFCPDFPGKPETNGC